VADEAAARAELLALLQDPARRAKMGAAAGAWHTANQGATERTLTALNTLLG
jgi:3-deoxy-D-manno-octulosonic-acid transferase